MGELVFVLLGLVLGTALRTWAVVAKVCLDLIAIVLFWNVATCRYYNRTGLPGPQRPLFPLASTLTAL